MDRRGFTQIEKRAHYSRIESSMLRTHNPTYTTYWGDGTGRDTYTVVNNGGLSSSEKQNMMYRPFRNTF